jgi:hypothetical protein
LGIVALETDRLRCGQLGAEVALLASILPRIRRTAEFEADLQTFYG